ncbi:3-keto-steroid reductase [Aspergillus pseudoviridinutans]|uniref:3-keto-steroid reductase n=1 Tax=Aspergillus pseudoviridinutans TaxID=1517512 RepID=A0A9P3B3G1_9EURO|nr:3-keto-steroid reductase [Aspergillus pseudoviridinutans]GIJ81913.1 3-keto-steroid reductase [Aspergillus pseudoviridinutans]
MSDRDTPNDLQDKVFVLVTGANSGLGFSICCRLVDEFLKSHRHPHQSLTVIFTTRSTKKGNDTLLRLQDHLRGASASVPASAAASARVTFLPENVDLSNLVSVRALSRRLNQTLPKLDAIVLNAGLGGWTGIDWPKAIWGVMTDLVHEVSWPSFKIAPAGMVTDPQTALGDDKEPRLGAVFCANVFGHYMLAHNVMPLLRHSDQLHGPGRVIWVSSLEATVKHLDVDDIQGIRTLAPYESSKALTDILALTSDLPSTAPWVKSFYSIDEQPEHHKETEQELRQPNMFLTHPGICGTGILPLSWPLFYSMLAAFWLARLLGSPWHTLSTYAGACAPVWLALSAQAVLDDAEAPYRRNGGGRVKWGSSCNRLGRDRPVCTEVDGWGYGGVVGPAVLDDDRCRRRKRGAADLTAEEKLQYEDLGRKCWQRMEELRIQWDRLLDEAEAQAGSKA